MCGAPSPTRSPQGRIDWMLRLKWIRPAESVEVRIGTPRAGAVDVALYTTKAVDALAARTDVDWEHLRAVEKGRSSPLAAPASQAAAR